MLLRAGEAMAEHAPNPLGYGDVVVEVVVQSRDCGRQFSINAAIFPARWGHTRVSAVCPSPIRCALYRVTREWQGSTGPALSARCALRTSYAAPCAHMSTAGPHAPCTPAARLCRALLASLRRTYGAGGARDDHRVTSSGFEGAAAGLESSRGRVKLQSTH